MRIDICNVKMLPETVSGVAGSPNVLGDMCRIPLKSDIAGTVLCDPPYDYNFLDKSKYDDLICELVRITKPGGRVITYAPWIFCHPNLTLIKTSPQKVGALRTYYKVLSVSVKTNGQLSDYDGAVRECRPAPLPPLLQAVDE